MRGVDTNIIVRFLTVDDPEQAERAKRIIAGGNLFVSTSVVLEVEWVLRSGYGYSPEQVIDGMQTIFGIAGIQLEHPSEVARALDMMGQGIDFADALHLACAAHCESFVTFDRRLAKRAGGSAGVEIELV